MTSNRLPNSWNEWTYRARDLDPSYRAAAPVLPPVVPTILNNMPPMPVGSNRLYCPGITTGSSRDQYVMTSRYIPYPALPNLPVPAVHRDASAMYINGLQFQSRSDVAQYNCGGANLQSGNANLQSGNAPSPPPQMCRAFAEKANQRPLLLSYNSKSRIPEQPSKILAPERASEKAVATTSTRDVTTTDTSGSSELEPASLHQRSPGRRETGNYDSERCLQPADVHQLPTVSKQRQVVPKRLPVPPLALPRIDEKQDDEKLKLSAREKSSCPYRGAGDKSSMKQSSMKPAVPVRLRHVSARSPTAFPGHHTGSQTARGVKGTKGHPTTFEECVSPRRSPPVNSPVLRHLTTVSPGISERTPVVQVNNGAQTARGTVQNKNGGRVVEQKVSHLNSPRLLRLPVEPCQMNIQTARGDVQSRSKVMWDLRAKKLPEGKTNVEDVAARQPPPSPARQQVTIPKLALSLAKPRSSTEDELQTALTGIHCRQKPTVPKIATLTQRGLLAAPWECNYSPRPNLNASPKVTQGDMRAFFAKARQVGETSTGRGHHAETIRQDGFLTVRNSEVRREVALRKVPDTVRLSVMGTDIHVPRSSYMLEHEIVWPRSNACAPRAESYDTINSGTFCKVLRAHYRGRLVAVKCPDTQHLIRDPSMAQYRAVQEWRILCRSRHKNILHFIGGVDAGKRGVWLVTEYISGGDLYGLLHLRPASAVQPAIRLRMMKQLTDALLYLHRLNPKIVHKDIKTNNILVDEHLNLKLCDFGDAEEVVSQYVQRYTAATWQYAPPEIIGAEDPSCPEGTTEKVDIWALGCVFLEICLCDTPFKHLLESVPDMQQRDVLRDRLRAGLLQSDITIPSCLPGTLAHLIRMCLTINSEKRPCAGTVARFIQENEGLLLSEIHYAQNILEAYYYPNAAQEQHPQMYLPYAAHCAYPLQHVPRH